MPYLTPDQPPTDEYYCRRLLIPKDLDMLAAVTGAISELVHEYNWQAHGTMTPGEAADLATVMVLEYVESNCMIGAIMPFVADPLPDNVLECDGATYDRADYPLLYAVIADYYKDTVGETFTLPDMRGRMVVGESATFGFGQVGGDELVTLTADQMPSHAHTTQPHSHTNVPHTHTQDGIPFADALGVIPEPAIIPGPAPVTPVSIVIDPATVTVNSTGGGQPHENMPPYVALTWGVVAR